MALDDKLEELTAKLSDSLSEHMTITAALDVVDIARAVAREEIERAKVSDKPGSVAPPSDNRPTPGGVRVVWTEEAERAFITAGETVSGAGQIRAALPHLRVEVDRETRVRLADAIDGRFPMIHTDADLDDMVDFVFARLGLTLSDGREG